jgi:pyruvate/2-oxoglutarate dehydrogenase complex dihydrolipoamide acyltransferase (E2) component
VTDVVLPADAWEGVEAGTEALLDKWLVREGERVAAGQVVASVVVVKTTFEVTAPAAGVVERILVQAEETFARGKPLASIREERGPA